MTINENLKRAFYEDGDDLCKMNANPKRCGKFKKLNNDIFYKWISPFAKYYRKCKYYEKYDLILEYKFSHFSNFVSYAIEVEGLNVTFEPVYIPKKVKERDIDEYAYACISNVVTRLEELDEV